MHMNDAMLQLECLFPEATEWHKRRIQEVLEQYRASVLLDAEIRQNEVRWSFEEECG